MAVGHGEQAADAEEAAALRGGVAVGLAGLAAEVGGTSGEKAAAVGLEGRAVDGEDAEETESWGAPGTNGGASARSAEEKSSSST